MVSDETPPLIRSRTAYEPTPIGDQTPPNGSVFEGITSTQRSNSNKSAIGCRRKRGSSITNNCSTIGAAIVAANSSIVRPSPIAPKITGFAVASKKRNKDFHQLFRSVPEDDYLIEDYGCALQREILAHGRLYVSEGHLCFSSNIFGWVTTLVMSFDEIVSVEKRSTALVFKNGLMITTLHAKNVFASFTSRDSTYELIVGIWKLSHPSLRSSLNGVHISETGGGDKTEKDEGNINGSQSDSDLGEDVDEDEEGEEEEDLYDEDDREKIEDEISLNNPEESVIGSDLSRKVITKQASCGAITKSVSTDKLKEIDPPGNSVDDFPGPPTHAPTECSDLDSHYPKIAADDIIPAPLGKVWSLAFGSESRTWFRNFLTVDQKCFDYTLDENAKKPLGLDNRVRNFTYTKPLNGSIGPRQTKCICTETLEFLDFEKSINVTLVTQTPDVPSGSVFSTKTRYCFTWGPNNSTRLQITYVVDWTGKSWIKGPIEKGAADGQGQYAKDIVAALKSTVSSRRNPVTFMNKSKKGRRKGKEGKSAGHIPSKDLVSKSSFQNWGSSESLQSFFGPITNILRPLLTGNIMYGLLVGLLVASWFRFGFVKSGGDQADFGLHGTPGRIAAYEEMWRKEESELWKWLENRVGMEILRDLPLERKEMDKRLQDETHMQEREIEDAIKMTEERLHVLKKSVEAARANKAREDPCLNRALGDNQPSSCGVKSDKDQDDVV